jgi:integrase/recombinase XerC/integrase/recombinase XerD
MRSKGNNKSKGSKERKNTSRALVVVQGKEIEVGNNKDWKDLVASFISSQDVSESSRKLYTRTLSQYFVWMERERKSLSTLTRKDVLEYKDSLQEQSLSSLTISSYITAVRKFYEWAEGEKLYPNIAKGIKTPRRQQAFKKQHLTDTKSKELLEHFQSQSLRDYAIVNLILRTGLRTIEVVRANIEDITFKGDRRILKVWGKGRLEKDDFVVLSEKAYLPIRNYLAVARRGAKSGEPLFTSTSHQNYGDRLTTKTISSLCKDGLKAIGLEGKEFTAHSLRHTTAVAILKHGGQLTDVQSVLRHTSPVTSQIYTESVKEELRLQNAPELFLDTAF